MGSRQYSRFWLYINNSVPAVNLPDTVIYKFSQPTTWYFSQKGVVKKKSAEKLKAENIQEAFLRKSPNLDIVAFFVTIEKDLLNEEKLRYEYMNKEDFSYIFNSVLFVSNTDRVKNGILQRFVQPKGEFNRFYFYS